MRPSRRVRAGASLAIAIAAAAFAGCGSNSGTSGPSASRASGAPTADRGSIGPCPAPRFHSHGSAGGSYPKPSVYASCSSSKVIVHANEIPNYKFVQITPNPLIAIPTTVTFTRDPKLARHPSPLPPVGMEGVAVNGILIATPNEAAQPAAQAWGDPVFNYQMDRCMGHTGGNYHYHALRPGCFAGASKSPSPILAYAFDGFPVYGPRGCLDKACHHVVTFRSSYERIPGRSPRTYARSAYRYVPRHSPLYLDRCNGRVGPDGTYRYYATYTYPYIIGCYRGDPTGTLSFTGQGPGPPSGHERSAGYGCTLLGDGDVRCRPLGPPPH